MKTMMARITLHDEDDGDVDTADEEDKEEGLNRKISLQSTNLRRGKGYDNEMKKTIQTKQIKNCYHLFMVILRRELNRIDEKKGIKKETVHLKHHTMRT